MSTTKDPTILIIDCATSGFSPERDHILEICCILVCARTLDVLDTHNSVIRHEAGSVQAPDFHEALLQECADPERSNSLRTVEGFLLAGPWTTATVLVEQNKNAFDLRFLKQHMPTLHTALTKNRPILDLRAQEVMHVARGGTRFTSAAPKTYRAADDASAAYEELLYFFLTPAATAVAA